jgi:tRNA (guanine37-N1)-methyltransferase
LKKVTFITAFPEFMESFLAHSVIGRAVSAETIEASVVNLRDFAVNRYGQIDDYAFGSGGMLLMAEPLARALESVDDRQATVVYPSPQGVVLSQELVESLAKHDHLILVCGHYEGVDERFVRKHVDLEVSLGDFVLTGGELPAMVLLDAVARMVPGVVGRIAAVEDDSFYRGMLDHPHFTRPAQWRGESVPEELLSGDAAEIEEWRRKQAVARTIGRRPDLLGTANIRPYLAKRPYMLLSGETAALKGTLEKMAGAARLYGVERLLVVEADEERRKSLSDSVRGEIPEERPVFRFFKTNRQAFRWVLEKEKTAPLPMGLETRKVERSVHWMEAKRRILESEKPVVIGLSRDMPEEELTLSPLRGGLGNEERIDPALMLSVIVDRFFGCR